MRLRKNVLTTGEVAKLCNVAPRTVSKWFDAGRLRGYRIPGSKDRRIPIDHLIRFMRAHGIPLNGLEKNCTRIVVLDAVDGLGQAVSIALSDNPDYEVTVANSALEAGAAIHELKPDVVVADVTLPDADPKVMVRFVRSLAESAPTCLIGMAQGLSDAEGQTLLQEGFNGYLSKPFEVRALLSLIECHTASYAASGTTQAPAASASSHVK